MVYSSATIDNCSIMCSIVGALVSSIQKRTSSASRSSSRLNASSSWGFASAICTRCRLTPQFFAAMRAISVRASISADATKVTDWSPAFCRCTSTFSISCMPRLVLPTPARAPIDR